MNSNENQKKGNTILLTVIAIATLLVAVVGATFAYFTATISGNDNASSIIVHAANLGTITFTDGQEIKLENALPGANTSKQFTIAASEATIPIKYGVKLNIKTNEFIDTTGNEGNDLVYTLSGTKGAGTGESGALISGTENIEEGGHKDLAITGSSSSSMFLGQGTLGVGETHTYTFTIKFKETGSDQNSNQNKNFVGSLEVTASDESNSTYYYNNTNKNGTTTEPDAES